jgi:hypothetical protein
MSHAPIRPTKEDIQAVIEAQVPSYTAEQKAEIAQVAYILSARIPSGATCVTQALGLVPIPTTPSVPPAPPTFDEAVLALLEAHSPALTDEQKTTATTLVGALHTKNPAALASTCVNLALSKILS